MRRAKLIGDPKDEVGKINSVLGDLVTIQGSQQGCKRRVKYIELRKNSSGRLRRS